MPGKETFTPTHEENIISDEDYQFIKDAERDYDKFGVKQAKNLIEQSTVSAQPAVEPLSSSAVTPEASPKSFKRKALEVAAGVAATTVVTAAVGVGLEAGYNALHPELKFSDQTQSFTFDGNEHNTLESAVHEIKGWQEADIQEIEAHIKSDPANIDIFKDGIYPGTTITIPVSIEK